jgi:RND superfamily putative drug exporter
LPSERLLPAESASEIRSERSSRGAADSAEQLGIGVSDFARAGFTRAFTGKNSSAAVLLSTVALVGVSVHFGAFDFGKDTHVSWAKDFEPPSFLACFPAFEAFKRRYPRFLIENTEAVLISSTQGKSVDSQEVAHICAALDAALVGPHILAKQWAWQHANATATDRAFLSANNESTIFVLRMDSGASAMMDTLTDAAEAMNHQYPHLHIVATGPSVAQRVASRNIGAGFAYSNGIGAPFIAAVFWWQVRSLKLLLLPLVTTGSSLIFSYACGRLVAQHTALDIPQYQSDIMLFLSLALSIDYSFFLVTRFQEEYCSPGVSLEAAVAIMMETSGEVVTLSGTILVISWLALCFFPVFGLQGIGCLSALTVTLCMLCNLFITPAMLVVFSNFVPREKTTFAWCDKDDTTVDTRLKQKRDKLGGYYKCAKIVLQRRAVIPVFLFAVFAAGIMQLWDAKLNLGATFDFGKSDASYAYTNSVRDFPQFMSAPFGILRESANNGTCPIEFLQQACILAGQIDTITDVVKDSANAVILTSAGGPLITSCPPAQISHDCVAVVLLFSTKFNPFISNSLPEMVGAARAVVATANAGVGDAKFEFFHTMLVQLDAKEFTFERFPFVVSGCLALIFLLIGAKFRAVFVPIKLAITIVLPILVTTDYSSHRNAHSLIALQFIFGIAVLVYQKGIFDRFGDGPFSSKGANGISWLLPCSTVFLLIGLALDYDIFLFSRIFELRKTGEVSTDEAIIEAVGRSGPVITRAGVIMILAFLGMIANDDAFLVRYLGFSFL